MSGIVKCKFCEPSLESFQILRSFLPEKYEYMVCSFSMNGPNFKTRLRTSGKKQEFAQKWLEDFQMHSKCTMRVERTYPHSGTKNVFKIDLRCQHNTRPRSDKVREKEFCKNTDCPAKMGITIKRVVTERKSRSKDPHLPNYPTVLQLDFCHNHPISTPEILRHRSVLPEIKSKILNLFKLGHNPATALDMHKYDLQLEYGENYSKVSQDRALLPDSQFCYRLYYKILRRQSSALNGESPQNDCTYLQGGDSDSEIKQHSIVPNTVDKSVCTMEDSMNSSNVDSNDKKSRKKRKLETTLLDQARMANQIEDALCKFCENGGFAGMQIIDGHAVMALCTPLMHRVHTLVKQSAELVFVDAYGDLEEPNTCRVLLLATYSSAGALPLGCLVISSVTSTCIRAALDLWKQILPDGCFYGRTDGPHLFLTNDSDAERQSFKAAFPQSQLLVCISHILQLSWTFLWDRKNAVKKEHRSLIFSKVKLLLFSQTAEELEMNYAYIAQDNLVKSYSLFTEHLNYIYNHRHDWSLVYRRHLFPSGNDMSMFWESTMILLKDPILSRTRIYNQLQIIDFLSRLDTYYERLLIDTVNSRYDNLKNARFIFIEMPKEAYTITQKSESEYEVHNDTKDTTYQLDITLGMCECRTGKNGSPCKHQLLVFRNFSLPSYDCLPMNSQAEKSLFLQLATGQEVENAVVGQVANNNNSSNNNVNSLLNDSCSSDMTMHDLAPCSEGDYYLADGTPCDSLPQQHPIMTHSGLLNSHGTELNSHTPVLAQSQPDAAINQHLVMNLNHTQHHTPLPTQQISVMNHIQQNQHNTHNQHLSMVSNVSDSHAAPLSQIPQPTIVAQLQTPISPLNANHLSQSQAVQERVDAACKILKERALQTPQTFLPALDTFLKNLDKLSSDSSLEYALYSFGKFSKCAVPLFKRKVVNNKLVGLQSAGDLKRKSSPLKSPKSPKSQMPQ